MNKKPDDKILLGRVCEINGIQVEEMIRRLSEILADSTLSKEQIIARKEELGFVHKENFLCKTVVEMRISIRKKIELFEGYLQEESPVEVDAKDVRRFSRFPFAQNGHL